MEFSWSSLDSGLPVVCVFSLPVSCLGPAKGESLTTLHLVQEMERCLLSQLAKEYGLSQRNVRLLAKSEIKWKSIRPRTCAGRERVYYTCSIKLRKQIPITDANTAFVVSKSQQNNEHVCAQVSAMNRKYMLYLMNDQYTLELETQIVELEKRVNVARIQGAIAVLKNRHPVTKHLLIQLMLGMRDLTDDIKVLESTYIVDNVELLQWSLQPQAVPVIQPPPMCLELSEEAKELLTRFVHIACQHVCLTSVVSIEDAEEYVSVPPEPQILKQDTESVVVPTLEDANSNWFEVTLQ